MTQQIRKKKGKDRRKKNSCEPTIDQRVMKWSAQLAETCGYTLRVERLLQVN